MSLPLPRRGPRPKPREDLKRVQLWLYVTEAEFAAVARLALLSGDSLSAFARRKLLVALGISHYESGADGR